MLEILSYGGHSSGWIDKGIGTGKAQEIGKDDGNRSVAKV